MQLDVLLVIIHVLRDRLFPVALSLSTVTFVKSHLFLLLDVPFS